MIERKLKKGNFILVQFRNYNYRLCMSSFGFGNISLQLANMKILVIGSGGREHALVWKFRQSERAGEIFCADGNAGIGQLAECVNIKPIETNRLADYAEKNKIDLTFVGGETSLALGVADEFERRNLKIIGASEQAARLEDSKSFAKDYMSRHKIKTSR